MWKKQNRKRWPGALEGLREFLDLAGSLVIGAAVIWAIAWVVTGFLLTLADCLTR